MGQENIHETDKNYYILLAICVVVRVDDFQWGIYEPDFQLK